VRRYSPPASWPASPTTAVSLPPFAMQAALLPSDYYGGSATPGRHQPTAGLPATPLAVGREGQHPGASHVHHVPVGRGGTQLFPGSLATSTPQTFLVASSGTKAVTFGVTAHHAAPVLGVRCWPAPSTRFEPARRLRGFHHWFTARCTVLPCLPDPAGLAVPARPVVVGAAPTLPAASQVRLPPASTGLLRQPSGGSFHPTRSHGASWRTPLSPWTLPGLRRRRPVGMRIGGRSSSTASNMVASLALAALRISDSGSPPASPARCSLDPALPRSTGFAPVRSPL
jgi:hypothetical protein